MRTLPRSRASFAVMVHGVSRRLVKDDQAGREGYMQPGRRTADDSESRTCYEVLRSLNLKPDTVRKWFKRTAAADTTLEVLGVTRKPIKPPRAKPPESASELLLGAADRMATEVRCGNITFAKRLAREYLEARNVL